MRPAISSWPSARFYADRLLDGSNVQCSGYGLAQVALQPDMPPHYAFIDTSLAPATSTGSSSTGSSSTGSSGKGGRGKGGSSKGSSSTGVIISYAEDKLQSAGCRNPGEAALVQRLLLMLQACCRPGTTVGVITPYNAQVGGQA